MKLNLTRSLLLTLTLCGVNLEAFAGVGFDDRFRLYSGHLNGDNRADLYLKWTPRIVPIALDDLTIPVALDRRDVPDFALIQAEDGTFSILSSLTAAQRQTVSGWPAAGNAVEVVPQDVNFDGKIDLIIRSLTAIIAGANNQFVLASSTPGAPPSTVRAVNATMRSFYHELAKWQNAPDVLVTNYYEQWVFIGYSYEYDPYYYCFGYVQCDVDYDPYSDTYTYWGTIVYTQSFVYRDYPLPNQTHLQFANILYGWQPDGEIPVPSQGADVLKQILDQVWGWPGSVVLDLPPPKGIEPELKDDWGWFRVSIHLGWIAFEACFADTDTVADCQRELWGTSFPVFSMCQTHGPYEEGGPFFDYAITPDQHAKSAANQRRPFWVSRAEGCDPFAPSALGVVDERGMGAITMRWLRAIAQHKAIQFNETELGLLIMREHVKVTDEDHQGIPALLSKSQITNYHQKVFGAIGFPDYTFGGAPYSDDTWGGRQFQDALGAFIWCPYCDKVPRK